MKQQVIVCAANRATFDTVVLLGIRHWDHAMRRAAMRYFGARNIAPDYSTSAWEQGFVDNMGNWHDREDAYYIAQKAGQIKHKTGNVDQPVLYSEDLY
jgi:hypothetical protein